MNDNTVRSIVMVATFSSLIVVGAIFSFPSPWNPVVPFTMATLFVILAGILLGPWRGMAAVGLYLLLGIIGLPVFSGASGGIEVIIGPRGGFLMGYVLAALCSGVIAKIDQQNIVILILAALLGSLAIYLPGLPWMHWRLMGIVEDWTWASTWGKYTAPFLVGDAVKAVVAVLIARVLRERI